MITPIFKSAKDAIITVLKQHPDGLSAQNLYLKIKETGFNLAENTVRVYLAGQGSGVRIAGVVKVEGRCKECGNHKAIYKYQRV